MTSSPSHFELFRSAFRARSLAVLTDDALAMSKDSSGTSAPARTRSAFVAPAQQLSSAIVNEVLSLSGGLTFVALSQDRARTLLLEPMGKSRLAMRASESARSSDQPAAMCVSVEAREGVTTGISAADRALTISLLGEAQPSPRKLVRPGHVFPVETKPGGVLVKNALFEGAVDLAVASGFTDAALVVDVLDGQGELASLEAVRALCATRDIPHLHLSELTRTRLENEHLVVRVAEARLPTHSAGDMRAIVFRSTLDGQEHVALVKGDLSSVDPVLVRVQPELTFSDVFDRAKSSSHRQIERALAAIGARGTGVLVYLRRPFEVQLGNQATHSPIDPRLRPVWMMREYGLGAQILRNLGIRRAEVLTSTQRNLVGLTSFGIEIVGQRPVPS